MDNSEPKARLLIRFAAEFFVIVVGVLVALGVDEVVTARSDAARAEAYLEQIESELAVLAEDLAAEIDAFELALDGAGKLIEGMSAAPLAPTDSLDLWFARVLRLGPFQPEMVTLKTLVASGELLLIRDETLRAALLRFEGGPARLEAYQQIADQLVFEGFNVVGGLADMNVLAPQAFGTRDVSDPWDWAQLGDDVAFRSAIYSLGNGTRLHLEALLEFFAAATRVQEALSGAPDAG